MIKNMHVQGFKKLLDTEAEYGPFNVLIGPNGCGKSSVLQAIDFLHGFTSSSIEAYLKDKPYSYEDLPSLNQKSRVLFWRVGLGFPETSEHPAADYTYIASVGKKRYPFVRYEALARGIHPSDKPLYADLLFRKGHHIVARNQLTKENVTLSQQRLPMSALNLISDDRAFPDLIRVCKFFQGIRSYLLWDAKTLRVPSQSKDAPLGSEGQNLASFLKYLQQKHPNKWKLLVRTIRAFIPSIHEIRIAGSGYGWKSIEVVEKGPKKNVVYGHRQVSDGVLRLLAIASLQFQPEPPSVITLEEPENGVHPQLLGKLIEILIGLPKRKSSPTQVFVSTHSPYLLDHFVDEPECIQVMESVGPGEGVNIHNLASRRDLRLARRLLSKSLGELWYSGVIGGGAEVK